MGSYAGPYPGRVASKNTASGNQTRQNLLDGAIAAIRDRGIAGVSARTIAAAAGVNQALVFYHFGSVNQLLKEACLQATGAEVERVRPAFAAATSLGQLLAVGRDLQDRQRSLGHVTVLSHLLAGAQGSPELAEATRESLGLWIAELDPVLTRLLAATPLAGLIEAGGLARALAAGFVGIGLYEGVDEQGAADAFAALEQVAVLVEAVGDLGAVGTRVVRRRLSARLARAAGAENEQS